MPFSRRPTFHLSIESQTLTIWPCNDFDNDIDDIDIIYELDLTTSKTNLNWCPGNQISIFHEMTLTLTQWPWCDLDLRQVKPS